MQFDSNVLEKTCQKLKQPYIKHHVSAGVELYAARDEKKPIAAMTVNDEQSYQIWCVLKIIAVAVFVMWSVCKIKKLFKKIF